MPSFVDLHTHSTASDGTLAPAELVRRAHAAGLVGLALTDHDTVAGVPEAAREAQRLGMTFLPGIEISAISPVEHGTLHILGYCIDPASPVLAQMTRQLVEARDTRNPRIIQRLRELGIDITMADVEKKSGGGVVGRPHIAAVLLDKGIVHSIKQAFDQYLGAGGKAYVEKERLLPRRGIELIHQSGGIPVLAHPVQLRAGNDAQLQRILKDLVDMGLEGIEVIHSDHNVELVEKYSRLAARFGLLATGGSDFHGDNKHDVQIGLAHGRRIPKDIMDRILERKREVKRENVKT